MDFRHMMAECDSPDQECPNGLDTRVTKADSAGSNKFQDDSYTWKVSVSRMLRAYIDSFIDPFLGSHSLRP